MAIKSSFQTMFFYAQFLAIGYNQKMLAIFSEENFNFGGSK